MRGGAHFFDINTFKILGKITHQYFNSFKVAIKIISGHDLLIGAEEIFLLVN